MANGRQNEGKNAAMIMCMWKDVAVMCSNGYRKVGDVGTVVSGRAEVY